MSYKNHLENNLIKAKEILQGKEYLNSQAKDLKDLIGEIDTFKVKTPLIGGFNAGKSSLINTLLGKEILPTDIKPETAIATEIVFNENESIIAYKKNGERSNYKIEEIHNISPKEYQYIQLNINNPRLKDFKDVVIVDMPGLDSSIEEHNQALMNYLDKRVYFIVITDIEHGLQASVIDFIKEIDNYDIDFSIILSKIDHKEVDEIEERLKYEQTQASNILGRETFIGKTSVVDNDIEDFIRILQNINIDDQIKKIFSFKAKRLISDVVKQLNVTLKYDSLDVDELEDKIKCVNKEIEEVNQKLDIEENRMEHEINNTAIAEIMDDLELALNQNLNLLVSATKGGEDNFSKTMIKIIRPTLINSINKRVKPILKNTIENIDEFYSNIDYETLGLIDIKDSDKGFNELVDLLNNPELKTILVALGILTNVIAPWLELIILLIPSLLKLFVNEDEKIKTQITNNVIPQILLKLTPEVEITLERLKKEFVDALRADINKKIEGLKTSLQSLIVQKKEKEKISEEHKKAIRSEISLLNNIAEQL